MIRKRYVRLVLLACTCVASLGLLAGATPAAAKTKVVTKTGTVQACFTVGIPIPDWSPTATTVPGSLRVHVEIPKFKGQPQDGMVTSFASVGARIIHTDDGDLVLGMVSPDGKQVILANTRDQSLNGAGAGYGLGPADCTGQLVLFSDAFPTSIVNPGNTGISRPITGSFSPEQSLSNFVGGPAAGDFTFFVLDTVQNNTGSINAFSISFNYQYKAVKKKKKRR
jgi:subtilisin-like proprotein convertase family protein